MPRWLSTALLISVPCALALLAYDLVAIVVLGRGHDRLVPAHDLARGAMEDAGLTLVYALTVTPRVIRTVEPYPAGARRRCLIMLGLGLAWYEVLCAWVTRWLAEPPDVANSLVVLFVIPVFLAPWYVQRVRGWIAAEDIPR